jgi:hypothetical protein
MSDLNIDDFRRDTAITLLRLYNNFPRPHTLYISEVCGEDSEDEFGLISRRYEACLAAMMWLSDEGFIQFKTLITDQGIEQATLCLLGIELLLGANAEGVSRVESLRIGLASKSSTKLEIAINELLSSAVSRKL